MLWIIQKDICTKNKIMSALDRLGITYLAVQVSNNTITPDILVDNNLPIMTNGSIMLSNIAKAREWSPGSFLNDNYSYDIWSTHYQDLILNKNAVICSLKDAKDLPDIFFARPILDSKKFNGKLFTRDEFLQFQQDSLNFKFGKCHPDIKILIAKPKDIGQEHRHYIVDGEIVTTSRYKFAGQPNFKEGCDQAVLDVVQKAVNMWTPSRAFVLDTYISGDEIGIVEVGGICHAGLYEANVMKLVNALDSMPFENKLKNKVKI